VFCDVATTRSFSAAAASNGITQSAASQAVRQIEKRLGAQLVDRTTRPLQLTAAGKDYFEGCKRILHEYDTLEAAVRQSGEIQQTIVRVSAIYSVGLRDMNRYVEAFERANPGASLKLDYAHTDRVYERIQTSAADLGLVAWPKQGRDLVTIPWKSEEMVVVCAPSHPFAQRASVRPSKLRGERFVGFDRGTVIRQRIDRFLRSHGVPSDVSLGFDNIENVKQAVEAGSGIALLPLPTVLREVAAGTLVAVRFAEARFTRPLGIVRRRTKTNNPLIDRFIELLRQPDETAPVRPDPVELVPPARRPAR
jgi:LysR family transcriptional regulator, low CO2-responsive transcriptional regulator